MTLHEVRKFYAGETDTATVTVTYGGKHGVKARAIHLYGDGEIYIKEATNAEKVNDYYTPEITRAKWVKIYDDDGKIYDTSATIENLFDYFDEQALESWSIYSAGNTLAVVANFRTDYTPGE